MQYQQREGITVTEAGREQRVTWPYTSFKTMTNLFERLEEDQAIPPKIDRSFLGGSEGQKTQVLAALKFFDLIGDDGAVKPLFQQIVGATKERPKLIRGLLEKHYPEATRLAGVHATTQQLQDTFAPLGGDTLRKAVTFYLHAAKYSGHPLSRHFKVPSGFASARRGRPRGGQAENPTPPAPQLPATPSDPKAQYLQLLMESAKKPDGTLDPEILNRIEMLLQLQSGTPPKTTATGPHSQG